MAETARLRPEEIRAAIEENRRMRARDLAETLGLSEAALVAAETGCGVTRIDPSPDAIMPRLAGLGEVMALTRNASAVHEKLGVYHNYHPGDHAAMVLNGAIDLRIFPAHWRHAFAVERETDHGLRRSLQVFDAAGDAVHKIHLRESSVQAAWPALVAALAHGEQAQELAVSPRKPTEGPRTNAEKAEILRREWQRMTDTHQFLRLTRKLKMNRLGAYRIAGAPFVRRLDPGILRGLLLRLSADMLPVMIFVGNHGCIQIHAGPVHGIKVVGPWANVLDPGFDLHVREDHVAEIWAVEKPTQRGLAVSVEVFDAEGGLILQIFGIRKEEADFTGAWREIVAGLPDAPVGETAA